MYVLRKFFIFLGHLFKGFVPPSQLNYNFTVALTLSHKL